MKPHRIAKRYFAERAQWWPDRSSRKRAWITNGHIMILAQRTPELERDQHWKRMPPYVAGQCNRFYATAVPAPRRVPSKVRAYRSATFNKSFPVRDIAGHPFNADYIRLVEVSYPGCEWQAQRRSGRIGDMARAYVNGRLVAVVMPMVMDS